MPVCYPSSPRFNSLHIITHTQAHQVTNIARTYNTEKPNYPVQHTNTMAHHTTRTTTTTRRHGLFGRRKVHHQKRKPTVGDKIAGAMKKLKGSIMHNPGEKVRVLRSILLFATTTNIYFTAGCWHSPHARNRWSWQPPVLEHVLLGNLYDMNAGHV